MINVFYYHVDRHVEYSKQFEEPKEAYLFYQKMKHIKYYITSYIASTDYEVKVMEGIYKC